MTNDSAPGYVFAGLTRWTAGTQNGLFRMAIGENRWERMANGLPEEAYVMCITVDPAARATVFVGTQDGPYRSTDHGTTWEKLPFPEKGVQIWSIAMHPGRSGTVFAGASPLAVYRSDDNGDSWRRMPGSTLSDRLPMGSFKNRVMRIAVNPARPDEVYAVMEVNGVMRSRDGGETWEDRNESLLRLAEQPQLRSKILTQSEQEGILDMHAVCTTPAAPGKAFIASRLGLFRTDDEAETWVDMEVGRQSPLTYSRDLRLSPHDPQTFYTTLNESSSGHTGTLYRSTDLGVSWTRFDHSVTAKSTLMGIGLDPRDPAIVHCATRYGQVFGTRDGGKSWQEFPLPEGSLGTYCMAAG